MNKCKGCGAYLQIEDPNMFGFTEKRENSLCNRCFRLRHYNEYQKVLQNNNNYISILQKISDSNDLVVLVVDLFLFHKNVEEIGKYLKNDVLLVLTKRDILPKKIENKKWISYFQKKTLPFVDIEIVSSYKNYHFDSLFEKINIHKKSKNVYVVGYTNAGKSTLINQIIYNYSDKEALLTTSMMPSTTLDTLFIPINDELTLIDTPGLLIENSLMDVVDEKMLKKIMPKKEIKPITYQVKGGQYVTIEDFLCFYVENVNMTLYFSNHLNINRFYKRKDTYSYHRKIKVKKDEDLVIEGLGFITVTCDSIFFIDIKYDVAIYTRKNII